MSDAPERVWIDPCDWDWYETKPEKPTTEYIRADIAEARIRELEELLRVARCPNCDGSGAIPHGPTPDGDWEWEQCQWCYERDALNRETTDDT